MIQDSGNRREFESGAVRDMAEGKGRCDLLPLVDVANVVNALEISCDAALIYSILIALSVCVDERKTSCVRYQQAVNALRSFSELTGDSIYKMMLEVAIHYEEGAKKYDERNWEKGLPLWCFLDSAIRHLLKYLDGWTDECHDRAFVWNMLGFMFTLRKEEMKDE